MEDWLKCQISSLVKYRQNPKENNFPLLRFLSLFSFVMTSLYIPNYLPLLASLPPFTYFSFNESAK